MNSILSIVLAVALAPSTLAPAQSEDLERVIQQYESSKNLRIGNRIPTILAFGKVKEPGSVHYLEKIFREEILPEAKVSALRALLKMEFAQAADLLIRIGARRQHDDLIVKGLGESTETEVRDLVYTREKGKGATNLEERLIAIEVVGRYGDERAEEALLKSVKDRRPEVRATAARALTGFEGEKVLDVLNDLLTDKSREVAIQAIRAISKWKGTIPQKVLETALRSKVWELRAKVLSILSGLEDELLKNDWVFEAARDRLAKDADWHVRAEAVKVLLAMRQKRCVEPLIDALGKEEGRMVDDVHRALVELTGLRIDAFHSDWEDWWERNKTTFEVPEGEGDLAKGPKGKIREEDQATYYGKVIRSKKVAFLIDFSKSMAELYVPPGVKETQSEGDEDKERKIDVAKKELIQAIDRLKRDVLFNILYFRDIPQPWKESLQRATPENRQAAIEFVQRGEPAGVTNIYDTIERALGDKDVDTIYLLTDGVPTAGKYKHGHLNEFKMAVAELNEHRRVSINTISFGDQTHAYKWFLELLAEENYGEYLER